MTLQNLLSIHRLQTHSPERAALLKLLDAAIQTLRLTMNISQSDIIVLDALRKQRNVSDYEGDPIAPPVLASCLEQADRLLIHTERYLEGSIGL